MFFVMQNSLFSFSVFSKEVEQKKRTKGPFSFCLSLPLSRWLFPSSDKGGGLSYVLCVRVYMCCVVLCVCRWLFNGDEDADERDRASKRETSPLSAARP